MAVLIEAQENAHRRQGDERSDSSRDEEDPADHAGVAAQAWAYMRICAWKVESRQSRQSRESKESRVDQESAESEESSGSPSRSRISA